MQEAAFQMFCFNVNSFRLHFFRILKHLCLWYLELVRLLVLLDSEIKPTDIKCIEKTEKTVRQHWQELTAVIIQYMDLLSSHAGIIILEENYYCAIHCWFAGRNLGLGP